MLVTSRMEQRYNLIPQELPWRILSEETFTSIVPYHQSPFQLREQAKDSVQRDLPKGFPERQQ